MEKRVLDYAAAPKPLPGSREWPAWLKWLVAILTIAAWIFLVIGLAQM